MKTLIFINIILHLYYLEYNVFSYLLDKGYWNFPLCQIFQYILIVPFLILQYTQKLEVLQTCQYIENMQLKAKYYLYIFKSTGITCNARYFNIYE